MHQLHDRRKLMAFNDSIHGNGVGQKHVPLRETQTTPRLLKQNGETDLMTNAPPHNTSKKPADTELH